MIEGDLLCCIGELRDRERELLVCCIYKRGFLSSQSRSPINLPNNSQMRATVIKSEREMELAFHRFLSFKIQSLSCYRKALSKSQYSSGAYFRIHKLDFDSKSGRILSKFLSLFSLSFSLSLETNFI
jgi:hypothetical protein